MSERTNKKKKKQSKKDVAMGKTLRLIRTIKNISLAEMAEKLEISVSYLSEVENGKKSVSWYICSNYGDIGETSISYIDNFASLLAIYPRKTMELWQRKAIEAMEQVSSIGKDHGEEV